MRVLLGMSGGFDSSYAAHKLAAKGYRVEGAVLVMHPHTDVEAARSAAERLGIPFHVIDCKELFERKVISTFISEYKMGRTPNPCIVCNPEVKFKCLYDYAMEHGFDYIATGHYARVGKAISDGVERYTLEPPADSAKDQSYMLSRLPQYILERVLFPLADEVKTELRSAVKEQSLPIEDKQDSQEICFIPNGGYSDFLERYLGAPTEGNFISETGEVLGRHRGITKYTVGQRRGLGISLGKRMFVGSIDPKNNTVTLLEEGKLVLEITLSSLNFVSVSEPSAVETLDGAVKIRYQAPKVEAKVTLYPGKKARISFVEPVKSPAPGQTAVIYSAGGNIIASGFIE
ncbi:MAG: tRNA 2-thiouridine(34) synthase MnmA [Clostridia bacterium]|nr:tRNA 2-thiouridine(34) synthase MnmA [Clostridia bacterium]